MLLLGATFTNEYAVEGAALCNPSIVAHPDQTGTAAGEPALRDERPGDRGGPPLLDRFPDRRRRLDGRTPRSMTPPRSPPPDGRARAPRRRRVPRRARPAAATRRRSRPATSSTHSVTASPDPTSTSGLDSLEAHHEHPRPCRGHDRSDPRHRRAVLRRRIPQRRTTFRARAVAGDGGRAGRHGGRPLRPLRRRRRLGHLLRDLHRLRRIPHQPATARDHRLPVLHLRAARRARRGQQGPGAVPPPDQRPLRRHVAIGPRDELRRLRRPSVGVDRPRRPASSRPRRGRRCSSETAVRRSKPTRAGWC